MATSSRARLGGTFGVLILAACAEDGALFVSLPPSESGGSIVLALPETSTPRYRAFDVTDGPIPEPFPEGTAAVEAYVYDRRLEALRIPSGVLLAQTNAALLPSPRARYSLSLEGEVPEWVPVEGATVLDELRVELESPCFRLEAERHTLTPGRPIFVDPLPDGGILHAMKVTETLHVELNRIDPDGSIESVGTIMNQSISAGGVFGDQLWLADEAGMLLFAPLSDPTRTSTFSGPPSRQVVRRFVVENDPATPSLKITTLAGGGTLERFEGGTWRTLRAELPSDNDEVDLLRLSDGSYLSAVPLFRHVLHEKDGVLSEEPFVSRGGPVSLDIVRGEPVVGLTSGEMFARRGGPSPQWVSLGMPPAAVEIYAMVDFGEGFVVAGNGGIVSEWNSELDAFCPPNTLPGYSGIGWLYRLGARVIVAGNPTQNRYPTPIDFVRPRAPSTR